MAKTDGIGFTGPMAVDLIRYDLLTQDALRGVVRKVLTDIATRGLPGEHHFYISFDTRAEGMMISDRLRQKYPEEMTIVLQHQFWDLKAGEHGFEVGVSFNGIPERLAVPYAAIKGFFDPSVQFGLQFEIAREPQAMPTPDLSQDTDAAAPGQAGRERAAARSAPRGAASEPEEMRPRTRGSVPASRKKAPPPVPLEPNPAPANPAAGAEVVRLDKFRKK
jgi:hypothetical protein